MDNCIRGLLIVIGIFGLSLVLLVLGVLFYKLYNKCKRQKEILQINENIYVKVEDFYY